jgi:hypothetical protein
MQCVRTASVAAYPLGGRGLGDPTEGEAGDAEARVGPLRPLQTEIDDIAHVRNGQGRLGQVGRQHHLPSADVHARIDPQTNMKTMNDKHAHPQTKKHTHTHTHTDRAASTHAATESVSGAARDCACAVSRGRGAPCLGLSRRDGFHRFILLLLRGQRVQHKHTARHTHWPAGPPPTRSASMPHLHRSDGPDGSREMNRCVGPCMRLSPPHGQA